MQALLVKVNGERVRLDGTNSSDWSLMASVHFGVGSRRETSLIVTVRDKSKADAGAWPERDLELGDTVTVEIIETDEVDPYEFQFPMEF